MNSAKTLAQSNDNLPPFSDDLKLSDLLFHSSKKENYGNMTQIGAGSSGLIYLAVDRLTGKNVFFFPFPS